MHGKQEVGFRSRESQSELATLVRGRHPSLPPALAIAISLDGARAVVALRGELDLAGLPALLADLDALAVNEVVLDLSALDFIDCSSLGIIVWLAATIELVVMRAPSSQARRLFDLVGFNQIVAIQE